MKSILKEFSHLFFPNYCPVCNNKLLPSEEGVCLQCLHKLPKTNNFNEPDNLAETLLAGRFPFERVATFCVYSKQGVLQPLIHQLKYNNKKEIGILLGKLFGKDLLGSEFINPIDFIVPVPLHPKKQKERGYNQAEIIANGLSEVTAIPVSIGNLVRSIFNPTQTKRTKTQRWENVKDIFDVLQPQLYADKHILLVDDIITTGSTLEACAHALLKSPDVKISIATLGEVF
ncbi:MAG: ComF family protein [Petrimonas sp.]|nr:MAG: DNA utilization protein GntX [Bacteroidetes bacterium ADurb.BinA174]